MIWCLRREGPGSLRGMILRKRRILFLTDIATDSCPGPVWSSHQHSLSLLYHARMRALATTPSSITSRAIRPVPPRWWNFCHHCSFMQSKIYAAIDRANTLSTVISSPSISRYGMISRRIIFLSVGIQRWHYCIHLRIFQLE